MDELTVATVTMTSGADPQENLRQCEKHIGGAASSGAQWVVLPEMVNYLGPSRLLAEHCKTSKSFLAQISSAAKASKISVFAGSVCESNANLDYSQAAKNVSYVFDRDGNQQHRYEKIHMFRMENELGIVTHAEDDSYAPGSLIPNFSLDGWRVGLAVCYDLRFPGFFQEMIRKSPVDVLVVPAAFTYETGQDHWHLLLRARAVELQCYVIASNQVGVHDNGRRSFGHSMVIDPWGEVLADGGTEEGCTFARISKSRVHAVRKRLPALKSRRYDLY